MDLRKFGFTKNSVVKSCSSSAATAPNESNSDSDPESSSCASKDIEIDDELPKAPKRKRIEPNRKYESKYLLYGYICAGSPELQLPLCLLCDKTFENSAMKPSSLKRHQSRKHANSVGKPLEYFQRLKIERSGQVKDIDEFTSAELSSIKSSFVAALKIAKEKKPYTIGERLLKPILVDATRIMLGDAAAKKMESIPLSATTVTRRIIDMSQDVQAQLRSQLFEAGCFTLQFDESTDVAGEAILIGFVRFPNDGKIIEELFCYCALPERTTSEQIFAAINQKMLDYDLNWKCVVGLCTDGAAAMTGSKSGLAKRVADHAHDDFISLHCVLHREALASKHLSTELNTTLNQTVKMINNIKSNSTHHRIFKRICHEMDSEHETLLLHADIRWLSRGKILNRVHELQKEMVQYFEEYMKPILEKRVKRLARLSKSNKEAKEEKKEPEEIFLEQLRDDNWLARLAYLADIFDSLGELSIKTQSRGTNCFKYFNKVEAFKTKLQIWKSSAEKGEFTMFPLISDMIQQNKNLLRNMKPIIMSHLEKLIDEFNTQFPARADPRTNHLWIADPFVNWKEKNTLTPPEQNQLIGEYIFMFSLSPCRNSRIKPILFIFQNFNRADL